MVGSHDRSRQSNRYKVCSLAILRWRVPGTALSTPLGPCTLTHCSDIGESYAHPFLEAPLVQRVVFQLTLRRKSRLPAIFHR